MKFTARTECCRCSSIIYVIKKKSFTVTYVFIPLLNCMIAVFWCEYAREFLPLYTILPFAYMHQTQLAETQFAYKLMRCQPIFIEQPGLKYPCWQFLYSLPFSHTFSCLFYKFCSSLCCIFPSYSLSLFPSISLVPALPLFLTASLQLEPRPLEILYQ